MRYHVVLSVLGCLSCQVVNGAEPERVPTAVFVAKECPVSGEFPEQPLATESIGAVALAALIPKCVTLNVDLGHIGMMVGSSAPELLYAPLAKWLKELA